MIRGHFFVFMCSLFKDIPQYGFKMENVSKGQNIRFNEMIMKSSTDLGIFLKIFQQTQIFTRFEERLMEPQPNEVTDFLLFGETVIELNQKKKNKEKIIVQKLIPSESEAPVIAEPERIESVFFSKEAIEEERGIEGI